MVGGVQPGENGRPGRGAIRRMFARIAPRYDFLNHLLSVGNDRRWRQRAVAEASDRWRDGRRGVRVLDTCAGTGDLALAFARSLSPEDRVYGCDYTHEMLRRFATKAARARLRRSPGIAVGDSLALPFRSGSFDVVSAAFGVRNVAVGAAGDLRDGLRQAFREMERVLLPGGRVVILEFSSPRGRWAGRIMRFYFRKVLPVVGNLISGSGETAYRYLPWSLEGFPDGEEFLGLFAEAGLRPLAARRFSAGLVTLYAAEKAVVGSPGGQDRSGGGITDGLR